MKLKKYIVFILYFINGVCANATNNTIGIIKGHLNLDNTWKRKIYLSHIPTFNDSYVISNNILLSETVIDSLGNFSFDISFLPENYNLFRIHIVKKGDPHNTLIIGGMNENHLFLFANCNSNIEIVCNNATPPFKRICYKNSIINSNFQKVNRLLMKTDSILTEDNPSLTRETFIEAQLNQQLRHIADTCANPLVSLYAIYKSNFKSNYKENTEFYETYLKKWQNQDNEYFDTFRKELLLAPEKRNFNIIIMVFFLLSISFLVFIKRNKKSGAIKRLSVQERKVFTLLKNGASNQEISDECNIGINTVKSHVSSILKKLKAKSRKEIMNME